MDSLEFIFLILAGSLTAFLPVIASLVIWRRWGISPRIMAIAAAGYVGTQAAILFSIIGANIALPISSNMLVSVTFLGFLSAAMDDAGKYLLLRNLLKDVRDHRKAIAFSVGWFLLQAVLIGVALSASTMAAQAMTAVDVSTLNASQDIIDSYSYIKEQSEQMSYADGIEALMMVLSGFCMQAFWTICVMWSIKDSDKRLFGLAVGTHWAVNVAVTLAAAQMSVILAPMYLLMGLAAVAGARRLKLK